jgi:hypothetical protein
MANIALPPGFCRIFDIIARGFALARNTMAGIGKAQCASFLGKTSQADKRREAQCVPSFGADYG